MTDRDPVTSDSDLAAQFYQAVGRIAVLAEHTVENARLAAMMRSGMFFDGKSQQVFRAFVSGIPAGNWPETLDAVYEVMSADSGDREVVSELVARWRTLITERNRAVHTQWFVGWRAPGEPVSEEVDGLAWRQRGKKAGQPRDDGETSLSELRSVGDRFRALSDALAVLRGCLRDGEIAARFERNASGHFVPKGKVHANPP